MGTREATARKGLCVTKIECIFELFFREMWIVLSLYTDVWCGESMLLHDDATAWFAPEACEEEFDGG